MNRVSILAILAAILANMACVMSAMQVPAPTPTAPATTPTAPAPAPTASPSAVPTEAEADTATVRAALVNVRAEPNGEVVGQLIAGTDVRVIGCDADWCEVETDDLTGFVFVGCLSISDRRCEAK